MTHFLNRITQVTFFVVASILLGVAYLWLKPPMQSPDEFNHFLRAYQVSEGKFLPEKKDNRLGGDLPFCLSGFKSIYEPNVFTDGYRITRNNFAEGFAVEFSDKERTFMDFPNTSYYSPVCYLPQACALWFLRQFNCSVGTLYYGTKIFVLMIWILVMAFVLTKLPVYKWLFAALLILPMNLYITTSFSADMVTNCLSFILIALCLNYAFRESQLSKKEFFLLLALGIFLALTKVIYVSLLLLLFLIPARNFKTVSHKFFGIGIIIFFSCIAGFAWSGTIMHYFISFQDYNPKYRITTTLHSTADYNKQKEHLLHHGIHIFKVVYNTVTRTADFYLSSYIGQFGVFMDTVLPFWLIVTSFCTLLITAFVEKNKFFFSWAKKIILFITGAGALSMVVVSQHLIWNGVGSDIADSIQGRYLIPVLPLAFLLFNNKWTWLKFNPSLLVIIFVFTVNVYSCQLLYERYFKETYISKVDFTSDLEEVDTQNHFKTSDPKITLEGGEQRTSSEHRSGKYAMMLLPDSSKGATYHFKDLHEGDLVEIYAWQKGGAAEIVVTGQGLNCSPYYFIRKEILISEKNGWKKLQQVFTMFVHCDSSDVSFFLSNPTKDTVYFDDLRYCVKKFR